MKTIHKYVLTDTQTSIPTHAGARFLHVAEQHGHLALWAEVETTRSECVRRVHVVPTGGQVPWEPSLEFVGTALLQAGLLVLHVYLGAER